MGSAHRLTKVNILLKCNENLSKVFRTYGADTKVLQTEGRKDGRTDGQTDRQTYRQMRDIPIIPLPFHAGGLKRLECLCVFEGNSSPNYTLVLNRYIFSVINSANFILSPFIMGYSFHRKEFALMSKLFPFRIVPFGTVPAHRKANRKLQKYFPFKKKKQKTCVYPCT